MRVTYDWTEADWNEAVTLATEQPRRRGNVPGMVYALVGIPLFGAVMDGVRSVRGTGKLTGTGMTVPLLLLLLALLLLAGIVFARMRRTQRIRSQRPMPAGQWEAALLEAGWSFHAKAVDVPGVPALTGAAEVVEVSGPGARAAEPASSCTKLSAAVTETMAPVDSAAETMIGPPSIETVPASASPVEGEAVAAEQAALPWIAAESSPVASGGDVALLPTADSAASLPGANAAPAMSTEHAEISVVKGDAALHPWKELTGSRTGDRVIVLLYPGGFQALPIRCMTPEQASHVHRMVLRKLRPAPTAANR